MVGLGGGRIGRGFGGSEVYGDVLAAVWGGDGFVYGSGGGERGKGGGAEFVAQCAAAGYRRGAFRVLGRRCADGIRAVVGRAAGAARAAELVAGGDRRGGVRGVGGDWADGAGRCERERGIAGGDLDAGRDG